MTVTYQIEVCDDFVTVGTVNAGSFTGSMRRNGSGSFRLVTVPAAVTLSAAVETVNSVIVWESPDVGSDRIVYAGMTVPAGAAAAGLSRIYQPAGGQAWEFVGVDLYGLLDLRLAWPDRPAGRDNGRRRHGTVEARPAN